MKVAEGRVRFIGDFRNRFLQKGLRNERAAPWLKNYGSSDTLVEYAGGAVTLHELIALAEASNPILRSAETEVEAAQGDRVCHRAN